MEDTQAAADTSAESSSVESSIENFDFSKPDGGLLENQSSDESTNSSRETTDESQSDDSVKQDDITTESDGQSERDGEQDISKMSEAERNNYFAQRRIEAKREAEAADSQLLDELQSRALEEYVDVEPNEQDFEDMDPAVAEQIRELRRNERARQAEHALAQVKTARESTRLSIMQAEASIPLFNPNSDNYNQFFHEEALSEWAHRYAEVATDANGEPQVVGTKVGAPSPAEYLQHKASRYQAIIKAERARGQKYAYRNRAGSEVVSSSQSKGGSTANDLEARIGDIPLTDF